MKGWADRFWAKVNRSELPELADACWYWTGALENGGYGMFWVEGKTERAHRVAYELKVGPIPEGLTLDHLCRNRRCVNPSHLELCGAGENARRSPNAPYNVARAKERCVRGHRFTEANTYLRNGKDRICRRCKAMDSRRAASERRKT